MVATTPTSPSRTPAINGWVIVTRLIALLTFLQPLLIGLLFSGYPVGLDAHRNNAYAVLYLTLGSLVVAIATRRKTPEGRRMIGLFARMLIGIIAVAILGVLSHEGIIRLHWLHFPAGVALVGMATSLVSAAQGLYRPDDND